MIVDTLLKLVTIKRLKMNKSYNCKMMSTTKKTSKPIFWGGSNFRGCFFRGGIFLDTLNSKRKNNLCLWFNSD